MNRVLQFKDLLLLGFGYLIGSSVFTLSGIGAKLAGNASSIAWFLSGILAGLTALVFSEFSSKLQGSGSSYIYAYVLSGEFTAWMVSWNTVVRLCYDVAYSSRSFTSFFKGTIEYYGFKIPLIL